MSIQKFTSNGCTIHDNSGRFIAQVLASEFEDLEDCRLLIEGYDCPPCSEALKITKLLSAAPEMLEALEACFSELNQLSFLHEKNLTAPILEKAAAAIAKAKGAL